MRYRLDRDSDDSDSDEDSRFGSSSRRSDYRVRIDDNECSLTIRKMREEDEGPWEVHVEDEEGDEEMRRDAWHT